MAPEKLIQKMNIIEAKKWLRAYLRHSRLKLGSENLKKMSGIIAQQFISLPEFRSARNVALYLSFGSEVDTGEILFRCWKDKKKVYIPNTSKGLSKPFLTEYKRDGLLKRTKWGPMELISPGRPFPMEQIDLVVVPGLGFDISGHRLGYGGGTYDRILKKIKSCRIGLFFLSQQLHCVPSEKHDQILQISITENGIVRHLAKSK